MTGKQLLQTIAIRHTRRPNDDTLIEIRQFLSHFMRNYFFIF